MKKIISLILVISMLFSMTTVLASNDEEFDISDLIGGGTTPSREEQLAERELDYVELNLFQDIFATYAERQSDDWWAWKEGEISSIWPYKGIGSGIEPKYPFSRSNVTGEYAMMIDLEGATKYTDAIDLKTNPKVAYDETLGRYIVSAKNTKYKLGEIAEGKKGGNFATFGVKYDTTTNAVADGIGIKEQNLDSDIYPNIGTSTQIQKAVYPINKTGVKEISFLMTSTVVSSKAKNTAVYVPATITYTDGLNTTKEYIGFVVGSIGASMQDSIYAVPASAGYTTVADVKANAVKGSEAAGKDIVNSNIIIPQLSTRTTYIPNESFILATLMRSYVGGEFAGYVHSFTIPVDSTRTIVSIEFKKDTALSTNYFAPDAGAIADGTSGSSTCLIPVEIEGVEDDNIYYLQSTRNCGAAGIFAMTLGGSSLNDEIKALEERMATATTGKEAQEIDADLEELISSTIVEKSDFDAEILAAYEAKKDYFAQQAIEEERQEKLKERKYTYVEFEKDRDVFASYKDISDLARFNKSSSGTTINTNYNITKYDHNGVEIFEWIPHVRADGTPVTGKEAYYYKGFANEASSTLPESERGGAKIASNAYIADDLFEEDGATMPGQRVNASPNDATHNPKGYYDEIIQRVDANRTVKNPTFVQRMDENGYVIIRNDDVHAKIGPVSKTEVKPNAMRLNSSHIINDVNAIGSRLDLTITSTDMNIAGGYTTKNLGTGAKPLAGLQTVKVVYKDGTSVAKKILITKNTASNATDTAYNSIVFAPKKDAAGNDIVYDGRSFYLDAANHSFTMVTKSNLSTIGLTSVDQINTDTVKFESKDVVYSTTGTLAQAVNNRQDVCNADYGNFTTYASIDLDYKEIDSIQMLSSMTSATEDPTAVVVANDESNTTPPSIALLPLTIEGASDDYYYFAYCGRVADASYLMGMTVTEYSAKEKIAIAEEAMSKITANSDIKDAKKALELYNIAISAENIVVEKDIDADIYATFMTNFEAIKENTPLSGKIDITYYEGEIPGVAVTIKNLGETKEKPYSIVLSFYDEKGIMVGKHITNKKTTGEETESFYIELTEADVPETTAKIKGFIWKDLATITPLTDAADSGKRTTLRILSIGNSYSQNAQKYLTEIVQNAGFEDVEIGNAYIGGCSLSKHHSNIVDNSPAYTYEFKTIDEEGVIKKTSTKDYTLLDCIKAGDWDIITIQQASNQSAKEESFTTLQSIIDYVNEHKTVKNAKVVWHQTWAYADNSKPLAERYDGISQMQMYTGIVNAIKVNVLPLDDIAFVIPAGTAVQNVRATSIGDNLTNEDAVHLNSMGCYVAGLTWFAKITGKSIDDITFTPNETPEIAENLDLIKKCVKDALANPYEVTK